MMKINNIIYFCFFILILPFNSYPDIGPCFDVQMLYKDVPVICRVTVEEVKPTIVPVAHDNRLFEGSAATLKVHNYYKGEGKDNIQVLYQSGNDVSGSNLKVYGWGFRNVKMGQNLIVFLISGSDNYRFYYDVYDTYMPISNKANSDASGFLAIREDIVNSIDDELEISYTSIGQVSYHGWIEALPK